MELLIVKFGAVGTIVGAIFSFAVNRVVVVFGAFLLFGLFDRLGVAFGR